MQNNNTLLALAAGQLFENQNSKEWLTTNEAAKFLAVTLQRRLRFPLRDCRTLFLRKGA